MPDADSFTPTREQARLIERCTEVVSRDERIEAAWLAGSFAAGTADEFSDIDLHCAIRDESADWFREHWSDLARQISPVVLVSPLAAPGVIGGYAITPEWQHFDIVMYPMAHFDPGRSGPMRPLFDRGGILPTGPVAAPDVFGAPYFPADSVNLYFYFLGNLAVVLGRGELIVSSSGSMVKRDVGLVQVMLGENGVRKTDGNKRLNRYLTGEQRAFLTALPPLTSERDSIVEFDRRVAAEVIRRGRALAAATGAIWPAGLEQATLAYLSRNLGVDFGA
jgi:Polymerase beta, Nucleotidyltransferase